MFKVDDLFQDVYERPPGHEDSTRPRKCEKRVLASYLRATDFHNKQVFKKETEQCVTDSKKLNKTSFTVIMSLTFIQGRRGRNVGLSEKRP